MSTDEMSPRGVLRPAREPLHHGLRQLQTAGDAILNAERRLALAALEQSVAFGRELLVPSLRAEEFTLFPAYERIAGAPGTLDVLVAQHRALARMVDDLANVVAAARKTGDVERYRRYLVPLLHGLYAAARVHLESEDEVLVPLVEEHLDPAALAALLTDGERIVRRLAGTPAPRP